MNYGQGARMALPIYGLYMKEVYKDAKISLSTQDFSIPKDYDPKTSPSECVNNVVQNVVPGSIIVMHENLKASKNVKEALPEILRHLKNDGYSFSVL
jgi:peptidoglycan/xylan/chitin deacetylase (PgdA/CDA1 family)